MFLLFSVLCASALLEQCFVFSATPSLPNNFTKCKKDDPKLNSCLQNAVMDAIRKMKDTGLPPLGVFPLDPLQVDKMDLSTGSKNSPINLNMKLSNMKIKGISKSTLTNYDARIKDAELHTISTSPEIVLESDYEADGKILLLPVTGKGKCTFVFSDVKTMSDMFFKPQQKNGKTYWIIQEYRAKFEPKKLHVHFEGLLNGDKGLNKGINDVLNENWEAFYDGIRPQLELSCGAVFKEITSRIFNKVPIDNIFD